MTMMMMMNIYFGLGKLSGIPACILNRVTRVMVNGSPSTYLTSGKTASRLTTSISIIPGKPCMTSQCIRCGGSGRSWSVACVPAISLVWSRKDLWIRALASRTPADKVQLSFSCKSSRLWLPMNCLSISFFPSFFFFPPLLCYPKVTTLNFATGPPKRVNNSFRLYPGFWLVHSTTFRYRVFENSNFYLLKLSETIIVSII